MLLASALLGRFLTAPARRPESWSERAGWISLAITFAGAALAVALILAGW